MGHYHELSLEEEEDITFFILSPHPLVGALKQWQVLQSLFWTMRMSCGESVNFKSP